MELICECCGTAASVAELRTPAVGDYSACDPCMLAGKHPPCRTGCGQQSESIVQGVRWCVACYDADQKAAQVVQEHERQVRAGALEREIEATIDARVAAALKARGL